MHYSNVFKRGCSATVVTSLLAAILVAYSATPSHALSQFEGPAASDTIADLADRYFEARNETIISDSAYRDIAGVPMTAELQTETWELMETLEDRRHQLDVLGERYSSSETETTVLELTESANEIRFTVSEKTHLYYEKVFGDEPDFTAYEVEHNLAAVQIDGTWTLSSDSIDTSGVLPITLVATTGEPSQTEPASQPLFDTEDAVSSATVQYSATSKCGVYKGCDPTDVVSGATKFSPSLLTHTTLQSVTPNIGRPSNPLKQSGFVEANSVSAVPPSGLNYTAMVDYAVKYWDVYNTSYRSFSNDCTNFISQALKAGGWRFDYGWYKSSSNWWYNSYNQTFTWAGAENWSRFAPRRTAHLKNVWMLVHADVLQMDFNRNYNMNHTMIVTKRTSRTPYLTYHTTDTLNRSLNSLLTSYPNAWYYAYRT